MWFTYNYNKKYESGIKIVIEADNSKEALDRFDEWSKDTDNFCKINSELEKHINTIPSSSECDLCEVCNEEPYPSYKYDIKIPKEDNSFVNLCIDYSEDTNVPLTIRSKRYYFKKTPSEVWKILKLWRADFYIDFDTSTPADPQYHRKYETLFYKAKLREKENK